jgi:5'-nucleotidase (lipoprotein e(P4) family)
MKKIFLLMIPALLSLTACVNKEKEPTKEQLADSVAPVPNDNDHMSLAVLYYQNAAETKALYYQGFNVAKMKLDQNLAVRSAKKKAIVLDIDETALDNSPYEAQCVLGKINYPEKWEDWCNMAKAEPTPGSVEFLKYAESKNVSIFYITNRKVVLRDGTIKNLQDKGFPMADTAHVIFRTAGNSKEERRLKVMEQYDIVLLLGDNLADFIKVYDDKLDPQQRAAKTDSLKAEFGQRFIVFPNPMYGDWEMAIYPDPAASGGIKDSLRKAALKGF